jgi:hypothetical protein
MIDLYYKDAKGEDVKMDNSSIEEVISKLKELSSNNDISVFVEELE